MYEVQTDIPIADIDYAAGRTRQRKYPFGTMVVGAMFFVPDRAKNTLASYAWTMGRELGRKFTTRMTWMKRRGNIWIPCHSEDPGATRGIGVWRTE